MASFSSGRQRGKLGEEGSLGAPGGSLSARGPPRLPKVPNVNKRAQEIIAAHMPMGGSEASFYSDGSSVPVLAQIDSTAPRTAISHDISHLCDNKGAYLTPKIPASLIAETEHVYEKTFMPLDTTSAYSEADGLWHTKVFPSQAPSSRKDAVMLDAWITKSLEQQGASESATSEELVQAVEKLVPTLSVALHEIVRQVTHQCMERGSVLEKIWRTYVELFNRVLKQMQESLTTQKTNTSTVSEALSAAQQELTTLRKEHPENMHRIILNLESDFTQSQKQFEADLAEAEQKNKVLKQELREQHRELEIWFPMFPQYQDSFVKAQLPVPVSASKQRAMARLSKGRFTANNLDALLEADSHADLDEAAQLYEEEKEEQNPDAMPPEVALAEDFKRLLAVLAPEKRKTIGREIAPVMDPKFSMEKGRGVHREKSVSRHSISIKEERAQREQIDTVDRLQLEIREQEAKMKDLRHEIAKLEKMKADLPEEDFGQSFMRSASGREQVKKSRSKLLEEQPAEVDQGEDEDDAGTSEDEGED
eukprot:TRINITY_DN15935_c0_g2_i1.p1 TRINITY_DN15935_c0_g2~~TRINITY_DN15935_c0_g2_i1.p1  ORF type:complete len:535 (+),score=191.42 TRINITY_DN15935_c0_g2_i1:197-1801(+)